MASSPPVVPNNTAEGTLPRGAAFRRILQGRNFRGSIWFRFFSLSTLVAILALILLVANNVNQSFGYVVNRYDVDPATVSDRPLEELTAPELSTILVDTLGSRVRARVRDDFSAVPDSQFTRVPIAQSLAGTSYPPELAEVTLDNTATPEQLTALIGAVYPQAALVDWVNADVVGRRTLKSWSFLESLNAAGVEEEFRSNAAWEGGELVYRSWINLNFFVEPMSSVPADAGIRTALLGTLWVIGIAMLFAFPIGVGAAIYLEEYASSGIFSGSPFLRSVSRTIETLIRVLAGVPSIIYGLLGLAVFVNLLGAITAGRSIFSAGLTMALLIMPVIIINSQEAIRSVSSSIREASYGLGATKWQTIWNQVIPAALPGILTGTILSLSRGIGETAPLIIVGAATYLIIDPNGPAAPFTTLPIQIYQWTSRPEEQFRNISAAAILVLLVLLLSLNATTIILRQRFRRKLQG